VGWVKDKARLKILAIINEGALIKKTRSQVQKSKNEDIQVLGRSKAKQRECAAER